MWRELRHEPVLGVETNDPLHRLPILEQDERRDAAHVVLHGCVLVLVDVQLQDFDLARVLGSDFLDHRRHHAARLTPRRPEIHQYRFARLENVRLERAVRYCYRAAHCVTAYLLLRELMTLYHIPQGGIRPGSGTTLS